MIKGLVIVRPNRYEYLDKDQLSKSASLIRSRSLMEKSTHVRGSADGDESADHPETLRLNDNLPTDAEKDRKLNAN